MESLAVLASILVWSASPSPSEVKAELDAHPWHPTPRSSDSTSSSRPESTAASATRGSGAWQLQLAAFQSAEAAANERRRLEKILGPGTVEISQDGSTRRLKYGRFSTKAEAEEARAALKAKGVEAFPSPRP